MVVWLVAFTGCYRGPSGLAPCTIRCSDGCPSGTTCTGDRSLLDMIDLGFDQVVGWVATKQGEPAWLMKASPCFTQTAVKLGASHLVMSEHWKFGLLGVVC